MILTSTEKKDALMLAARIQNSFDEYLSKERLNDIVEITYRMASFPEDSHEERELLQKVGLVHGAADAKIAYAPKEALDSRGFRTPPSWDDAEVQQAAHQSEKEAREMLLMELAKKDKKIRELYREVELKNEELKKLDKLKSDFISTISHELRTPITIIQEGVSQVMEGLHGAVSREQKEYLGMSFEGIARLGHVVNELLDISHLEAEKVILKRELCDALDIIQFALGHFSRRAKDAGIELKGLLPKNKIEIYLDREKIIQALESILDNALKFTEKGSVKVLLKDKEDAVDIEVIDTGKGIAQENLPKVFMKFEQFDRPYGPGEKGTGLGLAICKAIVELHGGSISIQSERDQGTTITITLPKLNVDQVFEECVHNGIKEAIRFRESLSVIIFGIPDFSALRENMGTQVAQALLNDLTGLLKKSLRRKADLVLKSSDAMLMMLPLTTKENVGMVAGRMKQNLEEYLTQAQLGSKIHIEVKMATFPDDASTYKELLRKAGRA